MAILNTTILAQDYSSNNPKNILSRSIKKTTQEHIERDDAVISESANNDGGYEALYDTSADQYRYSISLHGNHNPLSLTNFLSFEISHSTKQEVGQRELFAAVSLVNLATLSTSFTDPNRSDLLFSAGIGLTHRFKLVQTVLNSNNIFENVSAFLAGHYFSDAQTHTPYWGPGLKTDYIIYKRFSGTYHFGAKFSYNLASMFGEKDYGIVMSWLSMALDLGIYF